LRDLVRGADLGKGILVQIENQRGVKRQVLLRSPGDK
jgi:hypothetical protein